MQGMSKVGMTTRDPQDRINELSGATGVPSPFLLVYKDFFADCYFAEKYIHNLLEDKGYRVSNNREFFNGPLDEIIKTIQNAKLSLNTGYITKSESEKPISIDDEYSYGIFQKALAYYFGRDNCLQDYGEAIKLFKKAIKLGDINSYTYLGWMYRNGDICTEDVETCLSYLKEGSNKGNNYCNAEMGMMFISPYYKNVHLENGKKCWDLYFSNLNINQISDMDITHFINYIELVQSGNLPLRNIEILSFNKHRMIASLNEKIDNYTNSKTVNYRELYLERFKKFKRFIEENLKDPQETQYSKYISKLNAVIVDIVALEGFSNKTFFTADIYRGALKKGEKVKILARNNIKMVEIESIYTEEGFVQSCIAGRRNVGLLINGNNEQNKIIRTGNFVVAVE